jgi:ubiquinone/menaquinone biosynthesis C-methylase UbiE
MDQRKHWEEVYSTKPTEKLGWYEPHLQTSLRWINNLGLSKDARIIDIGGGVSTLVDDLLEKDYKSITVLDLSKSALSSVKARLGKTAESVTWLEGDITTIDLPEQYYELWHDRAVFHFLVSPEQQQQYLENLLNALRPGGHVIIGTFAPEAPPKCSGLPVHRYSHDQLASTLGKEFKLNKYDKKLHITPGGVNQMYIYCQFQRLA